MNINRSRSSHSSRSGNHSPAGAVFGLVIVLIFLVGGCGVRSCAGVGGFGPIRNETVKVTNLYVDRSSDSSHYMVGTDKGVFEVDNGFLLGLWNADEIYNKFQKDHTYNITTKGNRVLFLGFMQEYPYIIGVQEVATPQQ